jgi:hypothetical protein
MNIVLIDILTKVYLVNLPLLSHQHFLSLIFYNHPPNGTWYYLILILICSFGIVRKLNCSWMVYQYECDKFVFI